MKYMLLIHTNPDAWAGLSPKEQEQLMGSYWAFTEKIKASGEFVAGEPLERPDTATTLRIRDGKRTTTDGPFVETKEYLAGFYLVDCADLDRALELAAEIPDAKFGVIDVRPVSEFAPSA
jgi:hypothetical protein